VGAWGFRQKKVDPGFRKGKKPVNLCSPPWVAQGQEGMKNFTFINIPFIQIGALVGSGSLWPGSAIGMGALHSIPKYTGN